MILIHRFIPILKDRAGDCISQKALNEWLLFDTDGQVKVIPEKLSKLLRTCGENVKVKSQRIYEQGKVLLTLQSEMTINTVLFDHDGNAI